MGQWQSPCACLTGRRATTRCGSWRHPDGQTERLESTIKLLRSWRLMLSSDKPVYQPGQTIHLRSLALARPHSRPSAGHEVEFTISDPQGNRIFHRRDVTSRFGIASAECPLAEEIREGTYRVECRIDDTTSQTAVEVKNMCCRSSK